MSITTSRVQHEVILRRKLLLGMIAAHTTILVSIASAQQSTPQSPDSGAKFDLVSIRPVALSSREPVDFRVQPGGRLMITNSTLKPIIREAFAAKDYQITGGPAWLDDDRFDITAKSDRDRSAKEMMAMLQTTLVERFRLKYHWQPKRVNVYALVIAKRQPELKPSTADQSYIRLIRNSPQDQVGVSYTIIAKKVSMSIFAARLGELELGRPVIDETGLKGEFDFQLNYDVGDTPGADPQIFTAIREQLGLKLRSQKGDVQVLVIEHVEKPSEN
ncbi:MAG TPA: TIGR03435 family protein [Bryobacteraceae bacterium]|nr:TIGR03435 family protein [Bryobacteraceae bacterium]